MRTSDNSDGTQGNSYSASSTEELFNAAPNPFSTSTNFNYRLNTAGEVKILLYNSAGELANTLLAEPSQAAGDYSFNYVNTGLKPGLYVCQLLLNGQKINQVKVVIN